MGTAIRKTLPALATAGVFLLTKLKWVLALLKFSKFATLISMIISLTIYGMVYGWKFGIAFIYLLFIHEMGHLVAAKIKGVKTSPAVFIPFVGALISLKEQPKDAKTESYLAYGGPFLGTIAFLPAFPLFYFTNDPFWMLVIVIGTMLNLFNLIPVSPLDGGRIVTVLSTKIWGIGILLLGIFAFIVPSPMIFLVLLVGTLTWWNHLRESFKGKILEMKKQRYQKLMTKVENDQSSFYEVASDLLRRIDEVEKKEIKRKFFIPFIHDRLNLEKRKNEIEKGILIREYQYYKGDFEKEKIISEITDTIKKTEEELKKIKTYYQTSIKTKIIVFLLYLGLVGILSFTLIYGMNVLKTFGM